MRKDNLVPSQRAALNSAIDRLEKGLKYGVDMVDSKNICIHDAIWHIKGALAVNAVPDAEKVNPYD